MGNIIKPTLILAIVAFTASFALSHVYEISYPNILKQEYQKQEKALTLVLPGYSIDIKDKKSVAIDGKDFVYWIGIKKENKRRKILKGYAFISEKSGYSGTVKSMVGIDEKGMILGISVLQQSETPGLGARSTEVASQMTFFEYLFGEPSTADEEAILPWFQEQFSGLDSQKKIKILKKGDWNAEMKEELLRENAISAITGATITTKAVRDSIEAGIQKIQTCIKAEQKTRRGRR